jgi:xylan 1,4-beta-xylosidase
MRFRNLLITALCAVSLSTSAVAQAPEQIDIDLAKPTTPFPHFWEHFFGSCRATLSLRESYRDHLERTKKVVDLTHVRFHGIFLDDVGVYNEDANGNPVYNFTYVDQIYDGLLARGVKPFVELSFMPNKLAAASMPHSFWYKPNVSPPKSYEKWGDLVRAFTQHLVDRYGVEEVSKWYFEVWNEPNIDFWGGEPKEQTYYQLYDAAAKAVKSVSPRLVVGGPATAQAAWVEPFIAHCVAHKIPVDFVSTHVYGNDGPDVVGRSDKVPRSDMVALAVRKVYDEVKKSPLPNLPIIWSEYNASYMNEVDITDSEYMGPWIANNISKCDGLTTEMSFWTFSDVFEEQGVPKAPFYGGFGLIGPTGIQKPAFNAMAMLHRLGNERIPVASNSALATKRSDGTVAAAVWNYVEPGDKGATRTLALRLGGRKIARAQVQILDAQHGNALTRWREMGSPAFPTHAQARELAQASEPPAINEIVPTAPMDELSVELSPNALALVEITSSTK